MVATQDWKPGDIICRKTEGLKPGESWLSIHKGVLRDEYGTKVIAYANLCRGDRNRLPGPDRGVMYSDPFYHPDGVGVCELCEIIAERKATPKEAQWLLDSLKSHGIGWDAEHLGVYRYKPEEEQPKPEPAEPSIEELDGFKPFYRVLVRDRMGNCHGRIWHTDLFSHMSPDGKYVTVGGMWDCCIPYLGNEYLIGTTEDVA